MSSNIISILEELDKSYENPSEGLNFRFRLEKYWPNIRKVLEEHVCNNLKNEINFPAVNMLEWEVTEAFDLNKYISKIPNKTDFDNNSDKKEMYYTPMYSKK